MEPLIHGVKITPQKRIAHPQGDILHVLKRSGSGYVGFGEAYFSTVHEGVIKGWKRHRRVTLNLLVPVGVIHFVMYDDRPQSSTAGCFSQATIGIDNYVRLTVPPRIWLAFQGRGADSSLLLNIIDEEHDPGEAENRDLRDIPFDW